MIWFPWIFITANTLLHCIPGHPVMGAAISAWFRSAFIFLFFMPVAIGAAYYLAPKVTGRPIFSYSLAKLGFWSLAVIAPWAGMQKLTGAPIPYFLPYLGAAATALIFVPAATAAYNTIRTMLSAEETLAVSPSLRFTVAGITGLIVLAAAAVFLNLPGSTLPLTQFSLSGYGFEILAIYGFFSLVMFGTAYFIVPRVTRREWLSSRLINIHFLFSVYGIITVALITLFGGLQQGIGQEDWKQPWAAAASRAGVFFKQVRRGFGKPFGPFLHGNRFTASAKDFLGLSVVGHRLPVFQTPSAFCPADNVVVRGFAKAQLGSLGDHGLIDLKR
jgi:cytochrome c oxidase cbb3-type subunit 1